MSTREKKKNGRRKGENYVFVDVGTLINECRNSDGPRLVDPLWVIIARLLIIYLEK